MKKLIIIINTILVIFGLSCYAENSTTVNDKQFKADWTSGNFPQWELYKNKFNGLENKRCLEVGCFEGRGTLYFVENYCNGKGSYVDAIDTWEGSDENGTELKDGLYNRFIHNLNPYIKTHRVNIHIGLSSDMLLKLIKEVKDGKREKYDVVYIDASHYAKDTLMDAVLSWELLKDDGIMLFDDYLGGDANKPWTTPKPGIDAFLDSYTTMYKILHKGYQVHIQKISERPAKL